MNLHEYQAKKLLAGVGIPVPESRLIRETSDEIDSFPLPCVVKAQVHSGARGKAGGVRLVNESSERRQLVSKLLGSRLVTAQTGPAGLEVSAILLEQALDIRQEYYLSLLVDRDNACLEFVASAEGGMDIETLAEEHPQAIQRLSVDILTGLQPYQCRQLGFSLGMDVSEVRQFEVFLKSVYTLFVDKDLDLLEINPLVITRDHRLLPLDAKISVDDNALFRQPVSDWLDVSQLDPREVEAAQHQLNYIALQGEVGCMVNGAGLAMATLDVVQQLGGKPANFLDVGGGTNVERVRVAFDLILSDPSVRSVLVNIFGGIVRCDVIAEGILQALQSLQLKVPVIVRLEGTHSSEGLAMLEGAHPLLITQEGLDAAARLAVEKAGV